MPDINNEIDQVAETMEKSAQSPKEKLFETIRKLGPEGIRAKLPTLAKSEKELLFATLEEMKKAVSMDDQYQAKFVQGKITDTKIQEDKADDDQDEKLVKPEAAKMNHQGTPTEGWQGQVIKSVEASDAQMDELIEKAMAKCNDMKMVGEKLEKKGMNKDKVQGAMERYAKKKDMKKSEDEIEKAKKREEAKEKIMQMEEKEHGTKDPKKLVEAEKKEHSMKKSETEEIEKGKMKEKAQEKEGEEKEGEEKAEKKKMKKAVWGGDQDLLKARTQGRNHHFSVNGYYDEVLAEADKQGQKKKEEPVQKSEKYDVNEVIAKGEDASRDEVICKSMVEANQAKVSGKFVKSFADKEIAEALGLSEEEAKKILGE